MADTIDPNLAVVLNNNTKDKPQARRDQLIPEDISHISGRILTNIDKPDYSVVRPEAIVIKTFGSSKPKVGSIPWTKRVNMGEDKDITDFVQCVVIVPDGQNIFTPMPSSITNVEGIDHDYISMATLAYSVDASIVKNMVQVGDRVQIEYIDGIAEARIVAFISKGGVPQPDGSSNQQNAGTNMGDYKSQTSPTGDMEHFNPPKSNTADCKITPVKIAPTALNGWTTNSGNQVCGNNKKNEITGVVYPITQCKTGVLPNGQTATAHPIFFDQMVGIINDLLSDPEIIASGYTIALTSTYRTLDGQKRARAKNCPEAVRAGASQYDLYDSKWRDLVAKYKCSGVEASPAVKSTGHLTGMAMDFQMDQAPGQFNSSQSGRKCYEFMRTQSLMFKIIKKYAAKNGLTNYVAEPWHWSTDGH